MDNSQQINSRKNTMRTDSINNKWDKPQSFTTVVASAPFYLQPIMVLEWIFSWFYYLYHSSALVHGLFHLAVITSFTIGFWKVVEELHDIRRARVIGALKTLRDAAGKEGSFGQKASVEFLHEHNERLRGVNLAGAVLYKAELEGADLRNAVLTAADLSCAKLSKANLSGAQFLGEDEQGHDATDLREAKLAKANLSSTSLPRLMQKADLRGANLQGSKFEYTDLRGAQLDGAELHGALFWGADLSNTDLSRVNFNGVHIGATNIAGSNIGSAEGLSSDVIKKLYNWPLARFSEKRLAELGLPLDHEKRLSRLDFSELNFSNIDFGYSKLGGAVFRDAILSNVNFTSADLSRSDLRGADMSKARLTGALDLRFADLRGAKLSEVSWQLPVMGGGKFEGANIAGVVEAPGKFVEMMISNGAVQIVEDKMWEDFKSLKQENSIKTIQETKSPIICDYQ
jgi:uncharacterized protein YjbI with pentapeptide repeats